MFDKHLFDKGLSSGHSMTFALLSALTATDRRWSTGPCVWPTSPKTCVTLLNLECIEGNVWGFLGPGLD